MALGINFLFGPNFPGMRVLMSNVCYLAVILIFWLLLGGYCSLPSGYYWLLLGNWWLLIVTGGYCSLPLVTARSTFSMNGFTLIYHSYCFFVIFHQVVRKPFKFINNVLQTNKSLVNESNFPSFLSLFCIHC